MGRPGRPAIDRTGERYGLVTALERTASSKDGSACWRVRCDCGVERVIPGRVLESYPPSTHQVCKRLQREQGGLP